MAQWTAVSKRLPAYNEPVDTLWANGYIMTAILRDRSGIAARWCVWCPEFEAWRELSRATPVKWRKRHG
jgi:hypothetical protein